MEAFTKDLSYSSTPDLRTAVSAFFAVRGANGAHEIFWHLFRAWVCQGDDKKHFSEEEIASFLEYYGVDQVTAANVRDLLQRMMARLMKSYFP